MLFSCWARGCCLGACGGIRFQVFLGGAGVSVVGGDWFVDVCLRFCAGVVCRGRSEVGTLCVAAGSVAAVETIAAGCAGQTHTFSPSYDCAPFIYT